MKHTVVFQIILIASFRQLVYFRMCVTTLGDNMLSPVYMLHRGFALLT